MTVHIGSKIALICELVFLKMHDKSWSRSFQVNVMSLSGAKCLALDKLLGKLNCSQILSR